MSVDQVLMTTGSGNAATARTAAAARPLLGADDASNLIKGTLPDARLSANVPVMSDGYLPMVDGSQLTGIITVAGAVYGDGSDGSLDFNNSTSPVGGATRTAPYVYTMQRDIFATNMVLATGVVLQTNGYRLFASGLITLNYQSRIECTPNNGAADGTAGAALAGVTWGATTTLATAGGAGQTTNGSNGNNNTNAGGGAGGAGGHGASTNTGGNASTVSASPTGILRAFPTCSTGLFLTTLQCAGAGGAGGGGDGAVKGGGGGSGGGVCFVACRGFTARDDAEAEIRALGGDGGSPASGNAGGGGGGGGGVVIIVTSAALPVGVTTSAAGGAGGTHTGASPATDGAAGAAGATYVLIY